MCGKGGSEQQFRQQDGGCRFLFFFFYLLGGFSALFIIFFKRNLVVVFVAHDGAAVSDKVRLESAALVEQNLLFFVFFSNQVNGVESSAC